MTESAEADQEAMQRLRDGEDLALNEIMARWQEPLAHFLYRYTQSEQDALDLAQETFVRVYQARARYDTRGKFSTWLYTIAANLARNLARSKSRRPTVSLEAPLAHDSETTLGAQLADDAPLPAEQASDHEVALAISQAIAELPEDQREATLLFEYQDLPQSEIAAIAGCSEKAVETRLYRARQTLREKLGRWLA